MRALFPSPTSTVSKRWLALCAGTILLHVVALDWAGGFGDGTGQAVKPSQAITIALAPPSDKAAVLPVVSPAVIPAIIPPKAKRKIRPRQPVATPAPAATSLPMLATSAETASVSEIATAEPAKPPPEPDTASTQTPTAPIAEPTPPEPPAATAPEPVPTAPAEKVYSTLPPRSAELKYDVVKQSKDNSTYGSGKIRWQHQRESYRIDGEISILFFTLLSFASEGEINDHGLAPVIYSEKRIRKSATNTHFNRERNTISFSASTKAYPRQTGAQDWASILWQLSSIGNANSEKFGLDSAIDVFVAGVRDAETWRFTVLGQEQLKLGAGEMLAWHLSRAPRPGSYEQTLDIWLAPSREWYPVRVRYTEVSGDTLELSLTAVTLLPPGDSAH
jgi:hypothetical protein